MKHDIIYPIFLESAKFATDIFWENIFEELSYGKTPYGSYISKNFLCCNYINKEFSYKIERKNPEIIYKEIYLLFINKLGILSQKEKLKKRIDFNKIEQDLKESRKNWINIRKKNIKDLLIEKYVIDMKKLYNLSITQTKYLLNIIVNSIVFKTINSKDIEYYDNKIHNIKGITFSNNKIILLKNFEEINQHLTGGEIIIEEKKFMKDNWDKYLKNLKK